jgi:hypothetical protein
MNTVSLGFSSVNNHLQQSHTCSHNRKGSATFTTQVHSIEDLDQWQWFQHWGAQVQRLLQADALVCVSQTKYFCTSYSAEVLKHKHVLHMHENEIQWGVLNMQKDKLDLCDLFSSMPPLWSMSHKTLPSMLDTAHPGIPVEKDDRKKASI